MKITNKNKTIIKNNKIIQIRQYNRNNHKKKKSKLMKVY